MAGKTIWMGGGTPTLPQRPGDVVTKRPIYPMKSPSNK